MQKMHAICPFLFMLTFIAACHTPSGTPDSKKPAGLKPDEQIADYVVHLFEDSRGILWLGTIGKGVARWDGTTLSYLSTADGLAGNTVTAVVEDGAGNLWLGTHTGLSRYDGKTCTNFSSADGLCHERVSSLLIDKSGILWVGTWKGVCRYNGFAFNDFPLPTPDINTPLNAATMNWVTSMLEDKQGKLWFCRSGYGVCTYDGKQFSQFTQKDGLASNAVQAMLEDRAGNLWFGSRVAEKDQAEAAKRGGEGGLTRYDGKWFTQFPTVAGLHQNDVYALTEDQAGQLWIGANGHGLYRYDGKQFTLVHKTDRPDLLPYGYGLQSLLEDKNGTLWLGLSGGLFRLQGDSIRNVTQGGPWILK